MSFDLESLKIQVKPIDFKTVYSRYASFCLVGVLCFVKQRCVGFTSILLMKEGLFFELTRRDFCNILKRLNKQRKCLFCNCCNGTQRSVAFFSRHNVTFRVEGSEICQLKHVLKKWTLKKPMLHH